MSGNIIEMQQTLFSFMDMPVGEGNAALTWGKLIAVLIILYIVSRVSSK